MVWKLRLIVSKATLTIVVSRKTDEDAEAAEGEVSQRVPPCGRIRLGGVLGPAGPGGSATWLGEAHGSLGELGECVAISN